MYIYREVRYYRVYVVAFHSLNFSWQRFYILKLDMVYTPGGYSVINSQIIEKKRQEEIQPTPVIIPS